MFRFLFVSLIVVFFGSLSIPFDTAHAYGRHDDARNSMTPTEPMKADPGPFNDPAAYGIHDKNN